MKKLMMAAAAAALTIPAWATPAAAQDAEVARNNLDWWYVTHANFDGDKREWVEEWQENVIIPGHKAAGLKPPIFVHMNTGEWDMIIFSHMPAGPDMMTWAENPMRAKLDEEYIKILGSKEKLDEGRKAYGDAFTDSTGGLGHIDINEEAAKDE